jgi:hypothetical protein
METASRGLPSRKTVAGHAYYITPLNKTLAGVLICTLALFGAITASKLGIHDPFVDAYVASIITASHQTHINLGPTALSDFPGLGFLLLAMTQLSSISPVTFEYMPIGAIFALLVTYSLAKRFLPGGYAFAACVVASTVLVKTFSTTTYGIWQHTFGFMLFFLFIFVFLDLVKKRTIETLAALCIIFIGIHLYSYSAELMAISFFVFANVFMFARPKKHRLQAFSVALAFIAIYFGFNQAIYGTFVPKSSTFGNQIVTSVGHYLSVITHTTPLFPAWLYVSPVIPTLRLLNTGWYVAVFLPWILAAIYIIHTMVRRRSISVFRELTSTTAITLLAMLLVWPIAVAAYLLIGGFTSVFTEYYNLIAPLLIAVLLVYLLNKTPINGIRHRTSDIVGAYLVVLLIISALTLPLLISSGAFITSPTKETNVDPSAAWFFNSTPNAANGMLSDQATQGEYAIFGAKQGITFYPDNFYTSQLYGSLVDPGNTTGNGGSPSLLTYHYIVINLVSYAGRTTAAWTELQPLQPHMGSINSASNLIRIYDDGNVYTLKGL